MIRLSSTSTSMSVAWKKAASVGGGGFIRDKSSAVPARNEPTRKSVRRESKPQGSGPRSTFLSSGISCLHQSQLHSSRSVVSVDGRVWRSLSSKHPRLAPPLGPLERSSLSSSEGALAAGSCTSEEEARAVDTQAKGGEPRRRRVFARQGDSVWWSGARSLGLAAPPGEDGIPDQTKGFSCSFCSDREGRTAEKTDRQRREAQTGSQEHSTRSGYHISTVVRGWAGWLAQAHACFTKKK
jgi:hypothetical protein